MNQTKDLYKCLQYHMLVDSFPHATGTVNKFFFSDDGKLFHGSGRGVPFGPRCFEGDIMGCGIMFPRDFCQDDTGEHPICCTLSHHVQSLMCFFLSYASGFLQMTQMTGTSICVLSRPRFKTTCTSEMKMRKSKRLRIWTGGKSW